MITLFPQPQSNPASSAPSSSPFLTTFPTIAPPFSPSENQSNLTLPLDDDIFSKPFRIAAELRAEGYEVLAGPYAVCHRWMARRVLDDLARDPEIKVSLVKRVRGAEIWIKPSARQLAAVRKEIPTLSCHGTRRPSHTYQPPQEA